MFSNYIKFLMLMKFGFVNVCHANFLNVCHANFINVSHANCLPEGIRNGSSETGLAKWE